MTTPSATGFSIKIFLPDGEPDGLRIVEKSNWTGQAIIVPRPRYKAARARNQLNRTGVYVLTAPLESDDLPTVYIGEGDPVCPRLDSHLANKDFWTSATVFSSKDMNLSKAHVQYLESRLISLAHEAKRCTLDNGNQPTLPSLSEADIADMETFLGEMLLIFPVLGVSVFKKPAASSSDWAELWLEAKGVKASAYEDSSGFAVMKGSQAVKETATSASPSIHTARERLIEEEVLLDKGTVYEFSQDYYFDSPSGAACAVLGVNTNGRIAWKNEEGKTLKELEGGTELAAEES